MHIICNNNAHEGGIGVWSQIKVSAIFEDYRIQSNASNEITLTLSSEALLAALRSASASSGSSSSANPALSAEEVTVKLAKKNNVAVLSFEITGMTRMGKQVRVGHDVRIEVMKPAEAAKLAQPLCPDPDVSAVVCTHTSPSFAPGPRFAAAPAQAAHDRRASPPNVGRARSACEQLRQARPEHQHRGCQARHNLDRVH